MRNKYFLQWHDYDGYKIETFDEAEALEKRYTELINAHRGDNENGFRIDGVLFGKPVIMEPQKIVTAFVVKKDGKDWQEHINE